ncbi:SDR family NAD(P)-dependent oxidoreductase [Antrihabitans sp. YC2-6]|uniref:SDR family NAD(P)-dependent oxidoreductase n=1 Tax=Antrihabitans sp. YC2-6 TaxID=2799498 RepID=UPI0018F3F1A3|nr:SDR family NAD(P)-dependent oxidoreductase [Antrihabitans sp. YC2-6]MBJ8345428.1 SDR family NAD(P)-dependent oxidoreductase [Antrihabitans sp. YC2-6]
MNPLKQVGALVTKPVDAISKALATPTGYTTPSGFARLVRPGPKLAEVVRGKILLITGGSSGIGRAAAIEAAAAGATVLLVARGEEKLQEVANEVRVAGGTAHVYPCDLSNLEAIDELVAQILEKHGRVDILVNNAGRSIRRSLALSYDRFHDFERTMQLNYFAPLRLMLGLLPGMRERKFGHVINISTVGVQTRVPRFAAYIASKAALDTASDAFQAETRDENVHFTTIHMSLVRTPMIAPTTLYDNFPTLTPEEAGHVVCEAIIERPRRVSPAFGRVASFADSLTPEIMDVVRNRGFKMFGDSASAKGEDTEISGAKKAFVDATSGNYW